MLAEKASYGACVVVSAVDSIHTDGSNHHHHHLEDARPPGFGWGKVCFRIRKSIRTGNFIVSAVVALKHACLI